MAQVGPAGAEDPRGREDDDTVNQAEERDRRIVVGVDGSTGSRTALRWAIDQGQLTGATVEAVSAWQGPPVYGFAYAWSPSVFEDVDLAAITGKMLAETVEDETAGRPPAEILTRVVHGHPSQALLEAAHGAQMLVVGSRGHGAFAGMLLGSVSQHCVQHAPCPVVVVPPTDPERDEIGSRR
ncbi:universal stress protein [Micromonospora sp. DSM 115977]|uniref:Universal stress protein n=1 Tax=Micromonospora reichwaldensis TaxID=3075516 RepID=A0ABU2WZD4_9ACTN|nr:universal stress protein [Micromonospora sp. DSM 115977]MDT0530964.1 universal stress protein [Micromonospora sp. DSM 115977]